MQSDTRTPHHTTSAPNANSITARHEIYHQTWRLLYNISTKPKYQYHHQRPQKTSYKTRELAYLFIPQRSLLRTRQLTISQSSYWDPEPDSLPIHVPSVPIENQTSCLSIRIPKDPMEKAKGLIQKARFANQALISLTPPWLSLTTHIQWRFNPFWGPRQDMDVGPSWIIFPGDADCLGSSCRGQIWPIGITSSAHIHDDSKDWPIIAALCPREPMGRL